jgi:hypothetical protein
MSRILRFYLLGCIAIAFVYLLAHVREPLRLDVGDPSDDARVLTAIHTVQHDGFRVPSTAPTDSFHPVVYPPLADIVYCTAGVIGISDIGNLRIFALAFSALAVWLLYLYLRQIWSDRMALVATALFTTSLMWLMFADSIHRVPIMEAAGFLALWGLVRAIDTKQRKHLAAALVGSFACFLSAYDYWLVLPAGVLFTVHAKLGDPFARNSRRFVAVCFAGCALAVAAKVLFVSGAGGWHELADQKTAQPLATLLRRITLMFTPMFWVTAAVTVWRAVRAPSFKAVVEDRVTWLLAAGLVTVYMWGDYAGPHPITAVSLLPFYAIASALLIERLLDGDRTRRVLAWSWLVVAPAWAAYVMLSTPRAVLDRDDVDKVNEYFAANDRNDFVLSSLHANGPVEAMFERHSWEMLDSPKVDEAFLDMLRVLEGTGTDYVHALIFTTPESRAIESSLWPLALKRHLWSATGWPYLQRSKTNRIIAELDAKIKANLEAIHAKRVVHLGNFDVYRIDRSAMIAAAEAQVPVVHDIDFGSYASAKFKLVGWGDPRIDPDTGFGVSPLDGFGPCPNPTPTSEPGINGCETMPAKLGVRVMDGAWGDRAQVMIRLDRACDTKLTLELAAPSLLRVSMNDFTSPDCAPSSKLTVVVPARSVHPGVNVVTLTKLSTKKEMKPSVRSLTIDPMCESP